MFIYTSLALNKSGITKLRKKPSYLRKENHSYTEQELANIALVKRRIDAFSRHDIEESLSLLSDDVVDEDLGESTKHGKSEIRDEIRRYIDTFPNLQWEIMNSIAHEDQVLLEIRGYGTRSDHPLDGGKPGSRVEFYVASIQHVSNGKVDHLRAYIVRQEL